MKERGILFSAPMVRALLDGRKTQTRRVLKPLRTASLPISGEWRYECDAAGFGGLVERGKTWIATTPLPRCPYGLPSDRLWVRETWAIPPGSEAPGDVAYRADLSESRALGVTWKPAIHMFRWASRITLEVTGVRVERVQDISEDDARAEGCANPDPKAYGEHWSARADFKRLWREINGAESWDANPWVWAISFRRIEAAREAA